MEAIIFDHGLLRVIQELGECTIEELKDAYLPKPQQGIIQSVTVTFDKNLKELETYGAIEIKDGKVKYIKWATPPRTYF